MAEETVAAPAPAPAAAAPAPAPAPAEAPAPAPAAAPVSPPAAAAPVSPPADTQGVWPTNWREQYSKEDAKRLERLQRYASPEAALDGLFAAEQKIKSGELKPVLPKDPTPEQMTAWRKAHNVPEAPGQYELRGYAIDDAEKPMFEELFKAAHGTNQSHEQVLATAKAWGVIREKAFEAQATTDKVLKEQSENTLRAEWGTEYTRNKNLIDSLLDGQVGQKTKDQFMSGRLSDGTPIGSSPAALKLLLGLALVNNPAGVIVPGGNANAAQTIDDELASINKMMRTNRKGYDADEKVQARYRALLEAQQQMKGR